MTRRIWDLVLTSHRDPLFPMHTECVFCFPSQLLLSLLLLLLLEVNVLRTIGIVRDERFEKGLLVVSTFGKVITLLLHLVTAEWKYISKRKLNHINLHWLA